MSRNAVQPNRRILVVDDNPAIHADFKKILSPPVGQRSEIAAREAEIFGDAPTITEIKTFQVDSAFQGQEALALVQQSLAIGQPYAVAFIDVRMPPGWDGIETTAKLWEINPDLQIVICTAFSDYSWDKMIAKLGVSDRLVILKKPFDVVEVVQLAHALTEKWNLLQQARTKMEQLEFMVAQRTSELQTANEQLKNEMAEHARTGEALRQSQKMEALGQMAGGIAHDFNNLLTVIRGYVECLALDIPKTPEAVEALQEISQAAERATKLTTQMLMFSRKRRMQPQDLDLNTVIAQAGVTLERVLGENISLKIEPATKPLTVSADPVMMEQLILNFALNARDAMPQGGQLSICAAEIEMTKMNSPSHLKAHPGRFATISLADTGLGIAPETVPHLFEPFFTTKGVGKGPGLGLATAYGIVQQHGGWIEVASETGQGAKFTVFLPLNAKENSPSIAPPPTAKVTRGGETILLVEDEPVVRQLARTILQRSNYRVHEAGSVAEVQDVWRQHALEIDLLLTDMVIPGGMSGRELALQFQKEKDGLKVVYTSGYSAEVLKHDFPLEEGVNFLAKPYALDKLANTVRRCLDR